MFVFCNSLCLQGSSMHLVSPLSFLGTFSSRQGQEIGNQAKKEGKLCNLFSLSFSIQHAKSHDGTSICPPFLFFLVHFVAPVLKQTPQTHDFLLVKSQ